MDFEKGFEKMLRQYPEMLSDRKRFAGLMKDMFPEQNKQRSLICTAFELGIAGELQKVASINKAFAYRFVKQLVDDYGISRENADWVVRLWCVCYGERVLQKPCEISGQEETPEIVQNNANDVRQYAASAQQSGGQYDDQFEYCEVDDGLGITGFKGKTPKTLVIPGSYNGKPVTHIMRSAFAENDTIEEIVIADGIKIIEGFAFY